MEPTRTSARMLMVLMMLKAAAGGFRDGWERWWRCGRGGGGPAEKLIHSVREKKNPPVLLFSALAVSVSPSALLWPLLQQSLSPSVYIVTVQTLEQAIEQHRSQKNTTPRTVQTSERQRL